MKTRIGILGCGKISRTYLPNLLAYPDLEVVAVADAHEPASRALAAEIPGLAVKTPDALLADPSIELVLNLTIPAAHDIVTRSILAAGKHVYTEKPLATTFEAARGLAEAARAAGREIACAPDTLLGGGYQTCRKALDEGWIGSPTSATACMMAPGPEDWHPNPVFYYQPGGGPLWDMGPYYLSALVFLMGPVVKVASLGGRGRSERLIQSQPLSGTRIAVEVDTHSASLLEFASGAVATLTTTFDASGGSALPNFEVYGTEGTLRAPDPNFFGGEVLLRRRGQSEWGTLPAVNPLAANDRGAGVVQMAQALRAGRKPLASLELALHVTEILQALTESAASKTFRALTTSCPRPGALPLGWNPAHPSV